MSAFGRIGGVGSRQAHHNLWTFSQCRSMCDGSASYLDPVVHLDVVIGGVEVDPSTFFFLPHRMTTW